MQLAEQAPRIRRPSGRIVRPTDEECLELGGLGIGLGLPWVGGIGFAGGGGSFDPLKVANTPLFGYSSDVGIHLDGSSNVQQWDDRTAALRNATQGTAALRPGYFASNLIFSSATHQRIVTPSFTQAQPCTFFIVASKSSSAAQYFFDHATTSNLLSFQSGSATQVFAFAGSGSSMIASGLTVSSLHAYVIVYNGAAPNSILNHDGTEITGTQGVGSTAAGMCLGSAGGSSNWLDGNVAEWWGWQGVVSSTDRASLIAWSRTKWSTP